MEVSCLENHRLMLLRMHIKQEIVRGDAQVKMMIEIDLGKASVLGIIAQHIKGSV